MRLKFLLKYEWEKSSDKRAFGQMTGGQSKGVRLQNQRLPKPEGYGRIKGPKGSENGFKRGTKPSEMRWTGCPGKGRIMKRLIRTIGWMRYEKK